MEKPQALESINKAKSESQSRNFTQSIELIVNLKDLDLKKINMDYFIRLNHPLGKKIKVCALVGPELAESAKKVMDKAITVEEFDNYKSAKQMKKLVSEYDFFVGQANIMPQIASKFGKVLGSRGKMPNPSAGCIVPPNANLDDLYKQLQKTVHIKAKKTPVIQCLVGKEDQNEEHVADNLLTIMNSLEHQLDKGVHNIKDIYLKLTMGRPVKVPK